MMDLFVICIMMAVIDRGQISTLAQALARLHLASSFYQLCLPQKASTPDLFGMKVR